MAVTRQGASRRRSSKSHPSGRTRSKTKKARDRRAVRAAANKLPKKSEWITDLEENLRATGGESSSAATARSKRPQVATADGQFAFTQGSLFFVWFHHGFLKSNEPTNAITLELMTYLASPDKWMPELSWLKLHATCFLVASRAMGLPNGADDVATAINAFVEHPQCMPDLVRGVRLIFGAHWRNKDVIEQLRVNEKEIDGLCRRLSERQDVTDLIDRHFPAQNDNEPTTGARVDEDAMAVEEHSSLEDLDTWMSP